MTSPPRPPPPPRRASAPALPAVGQRGKRPVPFEELVEGCVKAGLLPRARVADLFAHKDQQLASLVSARLTELKAQGAGTAALPRAKAVAPVELLLSFKEKDEENKPLREDAVTEVWAGLVGLPYIKLDPLKLDPDFIVRVVSKPFARKNGFLALDEQGGALRVATFDPFDDLAVETMERATGKRVELVIASKSDIERLITEFYGFRQSVQRAEKQIAGGIELGNFEQLVKMKSEQEIEGSDEHVVHAVDYMFR
ncbi:MAG: hypothetical protein JNL21_37955, partial [Myxococcales bacterium]|nr:hypothetical protein [Myxococcales bacterium]